MKISKINTYQLLFKATNEDINNIVFDKNQSKKHKKADIGILLSSSFDALIKSTSLCNDNDINKILIAGGKDRDVVEDWFISSGVNEKRIMKVAFGNNVWTKIHFALLEISQYYNLDDLNLMLIANDYELKQGLCLMNKAVKNKVQGISIKTPVSTNPCFKNKLILKKQARQLCKLAKYGYIDDINIKHLTFTKQ